MECNKEEAFRAKQLAEIRLVNKDFSGALRIAQKAQRLFPELENISQLLAVCEVHCSSEKRVGSEQDWYGILQIGRSADDITIMKQYRKLALLLHPDKNKFAGSESAFKLIGEAKRILADREKRSLYDIKLRSLANKGQPRTSPCESNQKPSTVKSDGTSSQCRNASNLHFSESDGVPKEEKETFLTICTTCRVEHRYLKIYLGRVMRCQICRTPFNAYEYKQETGAAASSQRVSVAVRKETFHDASPKLAEGTGYRSNPLSKERFKEFLSKAKVSADNKSGLKTQEGVNGTAKVGTGKDDGGKMPKVDARKVEDTSDLRTNSRKRLRNNCPVGFGITSKKVNGEANVENGGSPGQSGCNPNLFRPSCRSMRQKQHISHNADMECGDGDHLVSPKKSRTSGAGEGGSCMQENVGSSVTAEDKNDVKSTNPNNGATSDASKAASPKVLLCPDAEFCDFDKDKQRGCFAVNQVWAIYDEADGMPRYYARVRKVFSPGFKLRITWFEADPDEKDQDEVNWCDRNLPVACGRYSCGGSEETEDQLMFSHQITYINGAHRGTFMVYPRKGETWALFMNWDIKWSSKPEKHFCFKYEFVEVLSDYVEERGITVAYLAKIEGFVSLFQQAEDNSFQIPRNELYRFSHRIPSFRLTGREGRGVLEGSLELDPAALPLEIFAPSVRNLMKDNSHNDGGHIGGGCGSSAFNDKTQPHKGSEEVVSPKKPRKTSFEREPTLFRRSPRGSSRQPQMNTGYAAKEVEFRNMEEAQKDKNSSTSDSKLNTSIKHVRKGPDRDILPVRRSPRSLKRSK